LATNKSEVSLRYKVREQSLTTKKKVSSDIPSATNTIEKRMLRKYYEARNKNT
jgi:hypothetical protein